MADTTIGTMTNRVAALYDIHGNLPALEAVLADIDQASVDCILLGGDIISGPMPREVLERLFALETPLLAIRGNAEREVVASFDAGSPAVAAGSAHEIIRWSAQQIDRSQRDFLNSLPATMTLDVQGVGSILFCHATPRSDEEMFTAITPEDRVRTMLGDAEPSVIVCGHTHMQFDRRIGSKRVVNAGSVGMPYGEPGAYWAMIGPEITLMRTEYDLEQAAETILKTSYPQASDFALNNVLHPASAQEAVEAFEPAETN